TSSITPLSFTPFHDPSPTEIYSLSLHDALPIFDGLRFSHWQVGQRPDGVMVLSFDRAGEPVNTFSQDVLIELESLLERLALDPRSEEHTSEFQSRENLVCRLLLEKKKQKETYEK